jgi:cell division septation protein DedD
MMGDRTSAAFFIAGAALFMASPALADVKAGVDAWTRGDFPAAVREWQEPAAKGDADAQFNLAQAYKLGRGVKQDLPKAEELFGKAAAQGHPQASDNYGLLLFQRGERVRALPYVQTAAGRGDPRAQYLLGIALFNGDGVTKDWVRAYALVSLAQQAGLAQATSALAQMDQHIPLDQRQQAATLAGELASQADATRARQLAAADLGVPQPPASAPSQARPSIASAENAVADAVRVAGTDTPRTAGADYARPKDPQPAAVIPRPAPPAAASKPPVAAAARPAPSVAALAPRPAASGNWRVQLGAFGVAGNAENLWNKVKGRPELSGHSKQLVPAGSATKLQAGGFASQADAQAACAKLTTAGFACIPARN